MNNLNENNNDVDDPEAMVAALESVKEWIQSRDINQPGASMSIRENPKNFLVRFHIPTIELTNDEIGSFSGPILKDNSFERLFAAKLWLRVC